MEIKKWEKAASSQSADENEIILEQILTKCFMSKPYLTANQGKWKPLEPMRTGSINMWRASRENTRDHVANKLESDWVF